MNQKQLYILIVLLVVIGGAGLYVYQHNEASWQSTDRAAGQKLLGDFPVNDVAQVLIKQPQGELHLVKKDSLWRVQERYDYPANFSEISEFLRKAWELKGVQRVNAGASQLPRLDLVSPGKGTNAGTLVEFKDKDGKLIRSLLLGKKHMRQSETPSPFGDSGGWPDGRYVMVTNGAAGSSVWLISDPMTSLEPKAEQWLNKDFLKVEKIRSVSVVSTNATNGWTLARETESGEMKLMDKKPGEELDTSKISGISSALSSASFVDVLPPDTKPETIGLDKPLKATLETFDHFVYNLQIGKETNSDNYPVRVNVTANLLQERTAGKDEKPEDKARLDKEFKDKMDKLKEKLAQEQPLEKWTFLVSKWTIDPLLKPRADLLAPPKKEEPVAATNQVTLTEEKKVIAAGVDAPKPPAPPAPPAPSVIPVPPAPPVAPAAPPPPASTNPPPTPKVTAPPAPPAPPIPPEDSTNKPASPAPVAPPASPAPPTPPTNPPAPPAQAAEKAPAK